jgi:formate hydrogenlyase transcriptional activator
VDVRVIAATNRHLAKMVSEGTFREDLYYRLNVFPLMVPPLRERGQDIALLASSYQDRFAKRMGKRLDPLHPEDAHRLAAYEWPGNIRELQNVIERAIILSPGTRLDLRRAMPVTAVEIPSVEAHDTTRVLTAAEMAELERANLKRALEATKGKIAGKDGAAMLLGIPASTFSSRMKALGIER